MLFEKKHIYHIYNQGNNRQKLFFDRENYLFFLQKMNDYLLPYCDILAWCLMPNHFHWMVYVRETEVDFNVSRGAIESVVTDSRGATSTASRGATLSRTPTTNKQKYYD